MTVMTEEHGAKLLYTDTDSLIIEIEETNNIENKLLNENIYFDTTKTATEIKDAVFVSPKTYAIKTKEGTETIKIKGVTTEEINFKDLKEKFYKNENIIAYKRSIKREENTLKFKTQTQRLSINLSTYNKRK